MTAFLTSEEVASITGHKIHTSARILDTYIPRNIEVANPVNLVSDGLVGMMPVFRLKRDAAALAKKCNAQVLELAIKTDIKQAYNGGGA